MSTTYYPCQCYLRVEDGRITTASLCASHHEDFRTQGHPSQQLKYVGGFTEPAPAPSIEEVEGSDD